MNIDTLSLYRAFQNTPPLWKNSYEGMQQFNFPKLDLDGFVPSDIPIRLRLGHQLEFIFHQLLLRSNSYKVLAYNLPIRKNKITIGEVDFILQNDGIGLIHLELTYKFYIVTGNGDFPMDQQLIGPNHRDTFTNKKDRLRLHQLPLPTSKEGIGTLNENGIDSFKLTPQVCFKSQLFLPYHNQIIDVGPFNSECISGTWATISDFGSEKFQSYQYYIPSKLEWLLTPHNNVVWSSYKTALDKILVNLENKLAPLLWVKKDSLNIEKIFILWRSP